MRVRRSLLAAVVVVGCHAPPTIPPPTQLARPAPASVDSGVAQPMPPALAPLPSSVEGHVATREIGPRGDVALTIGKGAVLWSVSQGTALAWTATLDEVSDGGILADGSAIVLVGHQVVSLGAARAARVVATTGGLPVLTPDGLGTFASDEGPDDFALYDAWGKQRGRSRGTIVTVGAPPVGVVSREGDVVSWTGWGGEPSRSVRLRAVHAAYVAPDGRRLFLAAESRGGVGLVLDSAGRELARVQWPSHGFHHTSGWAPPTLVAAAFSPDGARLALAVHRPDGYQGHGPTKDKIRVVDLATKKEVTLETGNVLEVGWRGDVVTARAFQASSDADPAPGDACFGWRPGAPPVGEPCVSRRPVGPRGRWARVDLVAPQPGSKR